MNYNKILILLLCGYVKATLEPQQMLQTRQVLEELSAIVPELPTSYVPLLQELVRIGIVKKPEGLETEGWIKFMQNIFMIDHNMEYLHTNLIRFLCEKLETREPSAKMELIRYIRSDLELREIYNEQILYRLRAPFW